MLNWIKFFVLSATVLFVSFGFGQVMFTQYIETNSGTTPKGVEIYNYTTIDIIFSPANNLQVFQGTNGGACNALAGTNITSGTLRAGEVWVIGTTDLTAFANSNGDDLSGTTDFGFSFNGDDALALYLGGNLMDLIGTCGSDPGSSWSGGGVSTANQNIEILDGICAGTTYGWTNPSLRFSNVSSGSIMTGFGDAPSCLSIPMNPEATNHPSNFGCTSVSSSEINLTWIDAIGAQLPDGYLIKWSDVSFAAITDPTDGSTANGANSVTVNYGVENVTITGLTPSTQYFFKIYPYTNSGAAIDYKIDGVIELTDCTTDTGPCLDESFGNIPTASSTSYLTRSWTGDDGYTFTATDSRSDQNINGDAILVRTGSLEINNVTGGVGDLTLTTQRIFSGGSGVLDVFVNGSLVGTIPYDASVQTSTITGINISGVIDVEIVSTNSDRIAMDDLQWTCYATSNTITTSTVSSATFNVDCSTGEAGTVGFTSSGAYNGGNLFTAELSDATGSFASPTSIGTLAASGTDPSGTINITIPAGTAAGTGYRIRVVSSDPVFTGSDNGTDLTVSLSGGPCIIEPPHMTSVIINSCNTTCSEGQNEVIFGNTGDYYVLMNSSNFELTYGTSPSPTDIYSDPLVSNSSKTSELNSSVGCPGLFVDGTGITLPPNSKYMLALDDICPGDVLDFSNLCGSGPIYVIYTTTASSWITDGNFVNSSSCSGGVRYFTTTITSTDGTTHVIDYSFDCTLNSGSDGDYATWNYLGGSAILQGNNGCTLDPIVLPITLVDFVGYYNENTVELSWTTLSEQNNDYFSLHHSTNGKIFEQIGQVPGNGNTTTLINYSFEHRTPRHGMNYYKLKSIDFDGSEYDNGTVSILVELNEVFYNQVDQSIQMNYKSDYAIYGSDGRLVKRVTNQNAIPFTGQGIYHVIDECSGKSFKLGIY